MPSGLPSLCLLAHSTSLLQQLACQQTYRICRTSLAMWPVLAAIKQLPEQSLHLLIRQHDHLQI